MIGKNSPDGTAMPKVIKPNMQYSVKNIKIENG